MKVYKIEYESNDYQVLVAESEDAFSGDMLRFDGKPKQNVWVPPAVRIYNPIAPSGDFYSFASGALILSERAQEILRTQLEMAGEILPLPCGNIMLFALNILECIDALDHDKTEWVYGKTTGKPIRILKHVFVPHLFSESTLFKIPNRTATMYTVEGIKDPSDEFKYLVEMSDLKGVRFKLVWEQD